MGTAGQNRNKREQRIYHPALLRGKERCSHHLLKSSSNNIACSRASCLCHPSWQGPGRAWDPACDWLQGAAWVEAAAAAGAGAAAERRPR